MTPGKDDLDFDPFVEMDDLDDPILARQRRLGRDVDTSNDDRRLPRPTKTRDMDQPGMDPDGEGDSDR